MQVHCKTSGRAKEKSEGHLQAEYDKAWEHLVEANRLQRETYTFNPQVLQPFTIPLHTIADTFWQQ